MPSLVFILLVSVFSRILYLKKYPVDSFWPEIKYMFWIVFFEVLWFGVCHFVFGIDFDGFPFR